MEEVFGQDFSFFNVYLNCLKLAIEQDEDLYDFARVVNFHCDRFRSSTLTEEQFRCLIFISGLQTKPCLPLRTRLFKLMEENPNPKLRETVRE
ncbi:unnamed protein product [Hymenolepis diminuta]|uniref:Uncharacterized protein n=1 Tax=Hymenolepis diminuta TaxID=6216 RepID=A0A564ZAD0_HYMDI|nr:unnamed protein product [Hymenolepis diminuta]